MAKVETEDWLNDENEPVLYGVTGYGVIIIVFLKLKSLSKSMSLDHVLVSCSKLNIIYVDLMRDRAADVR